MGKWINRLKQIEGGNPFVGDKSGTSDKRPPSVSFVPFVSKETPCTDRQAEIIRQVFADYEDETKFEIPW
jgi:hypothetical protein